MASTTLSRSGAERARIIHRRPARRGLGSSDRRPDFTPTGYDVVERPAGAGRSPWTPSSPTSGAVRAGSSWTSPTRRSVATPRCRRDRRLDKSWSTTPVARSAPTGSRAAIPWCGTGDVRQQRRRHAPGHPSSSSAPRRSPRATKSRRHLGGGRVRLSGRCGVHPAAKHAERRLAETLRLELSGKQVRVVEICPGMVRTDGFSLVRYHGDQGKADAVYDGVTDPSAADVAEHRVLRDLPQHVNIDRLVVKPVEQAAPHLLHRGPIDWEDDGALPPPDWDRGRRPRSRFEGSTARWGWPDSPGRVSAASAGHRRHRAAPHLRSRSSPRRALADLGAFLRTSRPEYAGPRCHPADRSRPGWFRGGWGDQRFAVRVVGNRSKVGTRQRRPIVLSRRPAPHLAERHHARATSPSAARGGRDRDGVVVPAGFSLL